MAKISFYRDGALAPLQITVAGDYRDIATWLENAVNHPNRTPGSETWVRMDHVTEGKATFVPISKIDYIDIEEVQSGVQK